MLNNFEPYEGQLLLQLSFSCTVKCDKIYVYFQTRELENGKKKGIIFLRKGKEAE